jgi:AraC-like DNA-binding protein
MYCPKCSRQQLSDAMRFCSQCGFQLDLVAQLLSNDGVPQKASADSVAAISLERKRKPQIGVKLMFFSIVLLPFIFALSYLYDSPLPFTIPVLIFFAGLSQKVYSYIFSENRQPESSRVHSKNLSSIESNLKLNLLTARLYHELKQTDGFTSLAVEGLMLELIAETSRNYVTLPESNRPKWLKQVEEILQARFPEQLTLVEIARSVKIHPTHLARVFHHHYGCTVGEYLRKLRIEHACSQLAATEAPLVEIALEAGFYDQSHFSRSFKRSTGLTPTEYRTALQIR